MGVDGLVTWPLLSLDSDNVRAIGIVIIMYFMLPAWVDEYQGIMVGFIPSILHIVSLLCIGTLLLPLIAV